MMCNHARTISLGFTDEPFQQGAHICCFYHDEEERQGIISRFLASGLAAGERTGYFAEQLPTTDLLASLEKLGLDTTTEQHKENLCISSAEQTYHPDGIFDPDRVIDKLHDFYADSMEHHYAGARISGEMQWALQAIPGTDRLVEYEEKVNVALKKSPLTAICQYNTNLFDGATIMAVLRAHPLVISNGQIMHNPFFSLPAGMDI